MAVVGEAHIVVRAMTTSVAGDIRRAFNGLGGVGRNAGAKLGKSFSDAASSYTSSAFLDRITAALNRLSPNAEEARSAFRALNAQAFTMSSAFSAGIGGISSLIGALGSLVAEAGYAAGGLAVLGNAVVGLGAIKGVAKLAFGGIGGALQALNKQTGATAAKQKNLAGQQDTFAKQRIADANRIRDAEQALAETIAQNRRQIIDANQAVVKAQLDVNKAIKDGAETIRQAGFAAESAALQEKQAGMDLESARLSLSKMQDLPPNNAARQQAELAYQQADLNLRQAKDASTQANDTAKHYAKTGVAGTQDYIDATDALAKAQQNQRQVALDSAQQQLKAEQNLHDARVAAAQDLKHQADAIASAGGGAGGKNPFAGLTASQIKFTKFLQSLKPQYEELKRVASDALLPPLEQAIRIIDKAWYPSIKRAVGGIAGAMGAAAVDLAKTISTTANIKNFDAIMLNTANLIKEAAPTIGHLFGIALSVLKASGPMAKDFAHWLNIITGRLDAFFKKPEGQKGLTKYFGESERVLKQFGTIFGNIFKGFGGIIKANFGPGSGGDSMMKFLIKATGQFAALNDSGKNNKLRKYFIDAEKNAEPIMGLLGDILKAFLKLGTNPNIGKAFDRLRDAVPYIAEFANKSADAAPALADLAVNLVKALDKMQDSGALKIFFTTLKDMAGILNDILANPFANWLLTVVGQIFAFSLAFTVAGKVSKLVFGNIVGDLLHITKAVKAPVTAFKGFKEAKTLFTYFPRNINGARRALLDLGHSANPVSKAISNVGLKGIKAFEWTSGVAGKVKRMAVSVGSSLASIGRRGFQWVAGASRRLGDIAARVASVGKRAIVAAAQTVAAGARMVATWVAQKAALVAQKVAQVAVATATKVATAMQWLMNAAMSANPIGLIVAAIVGLVAVLIWFFTQTKLGQDIWKNFVAVIQIAWDSVVKIIQQVVGFIVTFIQTYFGLIISVIRGYLTFLIGFWTNVWNTIINTVRTVWNAIANFIGVAINNVRKIIADVIGIIVAVFTGNWGKIGRYVDDIWRSIGNIVRSAINTVRTIIASVMGAIRSIWNGFWSGIGKFFHDTWNNILKAVGTVRKAFRDAFNGIGTIVRDAFRNILGVVRGPINGLIGMVNGIIDNLNRVSITTPSWFPPGFNNRHFGLSIPHIPKLAAGGVVKPTPGGMLANIAEAGRAERVEPLDPNGLSRRDKALIDHLSGGSGPGNINITVNAQTNASAADIAREVSRTIAFQMRKGATA